MYYKILPEKRESSLSSLKGVKLIFEPWVVSGSLGTITVTTHQVVHFLGLNFLVFEFFWQVTFCQFFHDSLFCGLELVFNQKGRGIVTPFCHKN